MKNKFGVKLDRNGYAPSIMQNGDCCWLCGMRDEKLDRHEAFSGPYRTKSKNLGLWVLLCHDRCHLGGVHKYFQDRRTLQAAAQVAAMLAYDWTKEDFIREFGKNHIEED